MSFAKSAEALRVPKPRSRSTPPCKTPAGFESTALLSQKFQSRRRTTLILATIVLLLEVGEFPKGGPWGQFIEASGNITPGTPYGNKKVTFCT